MEEKKTVTITEERYDELLFSEMKLDALESAGVDRWDWYGEAMSELYLSASNDKETKEFLIGVGFLNEEDLRDWELNNKE